jgi:hypothetical protein
MQELVTTDSVQPPERAASWRPWRVAPSSGFEVDNPDGVIGLVQIDRKRFLVDSPFRFADDAVITMLTDHLERSGKSAQEAKDAVEDARTYTPNTENPTDLASVPRYMRWFESSYGLHTLAAIIHDDLIVKKPNGGPLGDDTLSDRFFRDMMKSAGVPWLERWIMWSAVALRSRWAVGGIRRLSVVLWVLLSATGITTFVWAAASGNWAAVLLAAALPLAAAFLWGEQYGAGLVAATAAVWILPAAALAGVGYVVYLALECLAGVFGLD